MTSKSTSFRGAAHWGQMSNVQILGQVLLEGWPYLFHTFSEGKIHSNVNSPLKSNQVPCKQLLLGLWWSGTELQKSADLLLASFCRLLKIIYGLIFVFFVSVNGSRCLEKEEFGSYSQNWTGGTSQGLWFSCLPVVQLSLNQIGIINLQRPLKPIFPLSIPNH